MSWTMTSLSHAEKMAFPQAHPCQTAPLVFGRIRTQQTMHAKASRRWQTPTHCGGWTMDPSFRK